MRRNVAVCYRRLRILARFIVGVYRAEHAKIPFAGKVKSGIEIIHHSLEAAVYLLAVSAFELCGKLRLPCFYIIVHGYHAGKPRLCHAVFIERG